MKGGLAVEDRPEELQRSRRKFENGEKKTCSPGLQLLFSHIVKLAQMDLIRHPPPVVREMEVPGEGFFNCVFFSYDRNTRYLALGFA